MSKLLFFARKVINCHAARAEWSKQQIIFGELTSLIRGIQGCVTIVYLTGTEMECWSRMTSMSFRGV